MPEPRLIRHLETALTGAAAGPLLVACSGGMDSSVLLHALAAMPQAHARGLRAIHVHHGLHPDAGSWATHVEQACQNLGVATTVVRVNVQRDGGDGLEAAARRARHAAFEDALRDGEILVLAHHREDQAETFLLRALRSSGPDGLAAMRAFRAFGRGWLWRPLLQLPRSALGEFAQSRALSWVEDPGNASDTIDRNFLRRHVLPLLRDRWPHVDQAFARSAELSAHASDLLAEGDAQALARMRDVDTHILPIAALRQLDATRRARLLRRWIDDLGLPPLPAQGIAHIERDLIGGRDDREARFAWRDAVVRRWRQVLHADRRRAAWPADWTAQWDGRAALQLPGGSRLQLQGADAFDASLRVSGRRGGERMTLPGRTHSHALKHLLQDAGIPPWERTTLPLLFDAEGALMAAGDRLVSAPFARWLGERGACLRHTTSPD